MALGRWKCIDNIYGRKSVATAIMFISKLENKIKCRLSGQITYVSLELHNTMSSFLGRRVDGSFVAKPEGKFAASEFRVG